MDRAENPSAQAGMAIQSPISVERELRILECSLKKRKKKRRRRQKRAMTV
jgi:hypothetical protein